MATTIPYVVIIMLSIMMETFLEDAENSLHHRTNTQNGSQSSEDSDYDEDDPFLYDQFLPDPDWAKVDREEIMAKNLVDPGPFRYNKRVFVTSLPATLLVLALGGETLVLMAAVGTALLVFMSQLGDSRRCVITFVIIFIPSHTYVLASVIPLLWLSGWHCLLIALVNLFVILTAAWVLLQFKAFRMEEPALASVIEQMLFTLHPLVCTGLVCWALGAVIATSVIPIIFSCIWFVLLQLYMLPTLSSFKTQSKPDDNLDVVQVPLVVATVVAFVLLGPVLHLFLSLFAADAPSFSAMFFVHLIFMISLCLFLSTLLSIRQIFEHLGLPYRTSIYVRWVSGIICTCMSYPVLHAYGLDSHFLPLLPVAIAIFAALGVVLAFKKRKVVMGVLALVLAMSLIALFTLWIQRMPHNLQQYFLGIFPLNTFYFIMCANFLLCLLCLWMASINAKELLGVLLILQALVLTICEVSLHNSNVYSSTKLQLTAITASYTLHRLQVSDKITRNIAIIATGIHTAKSLASATSMVLDGENKIITLLEMSVLIFMTYSLVSVFLYGTQGEKSGLEVVKQLLMLLGSLAINSHHLLLPLSILLFQGSSSFTNVIGLWCMVGGSLVLLYSQAVSSVYSLQILKVALALGVMGICVMVLHPQLAFSFYSVFQWAEIVSIFSLVAILSLQVTLTPKSLVIAALLFSVCPGFRASLYYFLFFSEVGPQKKFVIRWSIIVLTICEVSLHNSNVYSSTKLQLTAITASYTLHRLQVSDKITRNIAIIATGIHTAKSLASATSMVLDGENKTITLLEMSVLIFMTYSLVSVFLYGTQGEKSGLEVVKQLLMLLGSLAINSHHLLLPLSILLFQGSSSFTNVIGLWCMVGGSLVLLYSQAVSSVYSLQILKVALALGVMGICVMVLHPQLAFSFYSVFQWAEIVSIFSLVAILSLQVTLTPKSLVIAALLFSVCPGFRASLYFWAHLSLWYTGLCVVDTCALLLLIFVCVFISEMNEASDRIMKFSIVAAVSCSLGLLLLDMTLLMPSFWYLWEMPAWKTVLVTCLIISITLKVVLTTKGPDKLPISSRDEGKVTLSLLANIITLAAFLLACTQGPSDPVLHDLWCCTFTTILGCFHQDHIFLPRLTGDKQATPTIMASLCILVISTICRSRLWTWSSFLIIAGGLVEVILVLVILPVFYVAWGILWNGQIISEPAVVFLTPYSILLILMATTYSTWILAISCLVSGLWMMMYKLPMVPYNTDPDHYR
ncbi:hypothetical protein Btru_077150 [Bulinus truncatus]|nr:hypothetical protein Btru_077150 [Bulinus truncatus]